MYGEHCVRAKGDSSYCQYSSYYPEIVSSEESQACWKYSVMTSAESEDSGFMAAVTFLQAMDLSCSAAGLFISASISVFISSWDFFVP